MTDPSNKTNHLPAGFDPFEQAGTFSIREGSELRPESRAPSEDALVRLRRAELASRIVLIVRLLISVVGIAIALYFTVEGGS